MGLTMRTTPMRYINEIEKICERTPNERVNQTELKWNEESASFYI